MRAMIGQRALTTIFKVCRQRTKAGSTRWCRTHFPGMSTRQAVPWAGLRPMMPDMMPCLMQGRNRRMFYNTGHGHLGWTLSAATADAVAALATGRANAA